MEWKLENVKRRVRALRSRLRIFNWMVRRTNVEWDEINNVVYAFPATWDELHRDHPITKAYIYQGDPFYVSFKQLFMPLNEGEEEEEEPEVINVPSKEEVTGPSATPTYTAIQPMHRTNPYRPNPVILNFYENNSNGSTSS
ncbi:hypothetical protein ACS0TY_024036 [Phlomoides rotata]